MNAFKTTIAGQLLLVICCIFYLIWWSISFRPDVSVNRVGGINGALLLITAICGLSGMGLSIFGLNMIPHIVPPKMNGLLICVIGIAAYIVLLFFTGYALHRPVTTELVLITGWAVLELSVANSLNSGEMLSDTRFFIACLIIAAAFVISMILYLLYYRMDPMKAFFAAMVPLITEGVSMAAITAMVLIR